MSSLDENRGRKKGKRERERMKNHLHECGECWKNHSHRNLSLNENEAARK